jgi:hypothetical protein
MSLAFIVGAIITVLCSRSAVASTPLPAPVAQVARAMKVPESSVSVWVQRIGEPQPRVAFNADMPRNPASVMKLVTSFAALEALGPAYTWKTEFHLAQPLRPDGSTDELWVRGGGDPFLVLEEHWRMLGALRERGLTRIERGLVFDVSGFDLPPEDPGAFDGQPDRPWQPDEPRLNRMVFIGRKLPKLIPTLASDPTAERMLELCRSRGVGQRSRRGTHQLAHRVRLRRRCLRAEPTRTLRDRSEEHRLVVAGRCERRIDEAFPCRNRRGVERTGRRRDRA